MKPFLGILLFVLAFLETLFWIETGNNKYLIASIYFTTFCLFIVLSPQRP